MNNIMDEESKKIKILADTANKRMTINKYLHKKLEIYQNYNKLTKEIMNKCFTEKKELPLVLFNNYTKTIQNDYEKIKKDYDNIYSKFNSLLEECRSEVSMGKPVLDQKKNEEFKMEYLIIQKEDIINSLKESITLSKQYRLYREPKRDIFVNIKKGNKLSEKTANILRQTVLKECKKCNKFDNNIKLYNSKIIGISRNIELLRKYIEVHQNFASRNHNSDKILGRFENYGMTINLGKKLYIEDKSCKNSDENRGCHTSRKNKRNETILQFIRVENLFDLPSEESEDEKIVDDELHSDDEIILEGKRKFPKQLSTSYLSEIKKTIPQFNFKQINFNKGKMNGEVDIYSLQRRKKYKSQNIDIQIKEQKKMIDKITYKLEVLKQKESIMKDFVKKLKDKYDEIKSMIYQTTVSNIATEDFIIKSLGKCFNEGDNDSNNADEKEDVIIEEKDEDKADDTLDEIFGKDVEERPIDLNQDIAKTEIDNDIEETKFTKDEKITDRKHNKEEEKRLLQSILKKNEFIKKKKKLFVKKISNQIESLPKSILISFIKKKNNKSSKRAKSK
jgi:hypothetical protein